MKNNDSMDYLSDLKLKVYQRTILLAAPIMILVWRLSFLYDPGYKILAYVLPFSIVFIGVSYVLFRHLGVRFLRPFELASFGLIFIYFLIQFTAEVLDSYSKSRLDFQKFLLWIAILYTLAFLIFPLKSALAWSGTFMACMFAIGSGYVVASWGLPGLGNDVQFLVQILGSGVIYISLLYAIAKLKEKYSEAEIKSELMSSLANLDSLTGAFSRVKIEELLNYYITQIQVHAQPLSVMMLDMDKLKLTNDTYGHEAGDHVLRRTVELCRLNLRKEDALGRIGGDEFLLVCPNTSPEQAELLASRLEASIAAAEFGNYGKRTISIGVTTWQPSDTSQSLIKRADEAMYQKKREKFAANGVSVQ